MKCVEIQRESVTDDIELRRGETWSFALGEGGVRVTVLQGTVWTTLEGDRHDYVLDASTPAVFEGPGLLVFQGLDSLSRVELEELEFPI